MEDGKIRMGTKEYRNEIVKDDSIDDETNPGPNLEAPKLLPMREHWSNQV